MLGCLSAARASGQPTLSTPPLGAYSLFTMEGRNVAEGMAMALVEVCMCAL